MEDRAGIATRGTAKSFYVASNYYEILQQFYALGKEGDDNAHHDETKGDKEEEGKRKLYCKWKATDILNAIKEGRTPALAGFIEDSGDIDLSAPVGLASSIAGFRH